MQNALGKGNEDEIRPPGIWGDGVWMRQSAFTEEHEDEVGLLLDFV